MALCTRAITLDGKNPLRDLRTGVLQGFCVRVGCGDLKPPTAEGSYGVTALSARALIGLNTGFPMGADGLG
jgi:hypothetical protein